MAEKKKKQQGAEPVEMVDGRDLLLVKDTAADSLVRSMSLSLAPITKEQLPSTVDGCLDLAAGYQQAGNKAFLTYAWSIGCLVDHAYDIQKREWEQVQESIKADNRRPTSEEMALRPYGSGLMKQAMAKHKLPHTTLVQMRQYYLTYPDPEHALKANINWSGMRMLLTVHDDQQRLALEKKASEEKLTVQEIKELVDKTKTTKKAEKAKEQELEFVAGRQKEEEAYDPVVYFTDLHMGMESILHEVQELFSRYEKMIALTFDEKITSEEDFALVRKEGRSMCKCVDRLRDFLLTTTESARTDFACAEQ